MGSRRIDAYLLAVLLLHGLGARGAAVADPFSACETRFAAAPEDYASAYCFYEVAQKQKRLQEGTRRIEDRLAHHPDNLWLRLALGHVQWKLGRKRTEELYRAAVEGFRVRGEANGEVLARSNLARYLMARGRLDAAGREVDRAMTVAEEAKDPIVMARALILRVRHLTTLGDDLTTAYFLLLQAEAKAFPDGPRRLRRDCLLLLGNVCYQMGRLDEALRYYERLETLALEAGDTYAVANCKYNILLARLEQMAELPRAGGKEELRQLSQDALATAVAAGHRWIEAQSHRELGDLFSRSPEGKDQARWHYQQCLDIAKKIPQPATITSCLIALAGHLGQWGPEAANSVLDEARASADDADPWSIAEVKWQRMRASWATGSREQAVDDSLELLDAIEDLVDRQAGEAGRASVFSMWTDPYYWLSGRLLEAPQASRGDLELAFTLAERLRARVLLEALSTAHATPPAADAERARLDRVRQGLIRLQRELLDPALTDEERNRALAELALTELEETVLGQPPTEAGLSRPALATLTQVEEELAENEAMLLFQVALWKDVYGESVGGSWLLVATRGGTRVHRLPDRVQLWPTLSIFRGLFPRRDGSEVPAAVTLHGKLLEAALADLPPGIERLVIVPDGYLHILPFAALRPAAEAEPLVTRYELSLVPSATLWLRLRGRPQRAAASVLALADALPPGHGGRRAGERQWALATGARLGSLPHARKEGQAAVGHLGERSRLLAGGEATEHALKQTDLGDFGILHFATHTVIDERQSQRSAVLLAPGSEEEDGLLQPRDIVKLDLDGRVVVLSACQSVWGEVLRGEGVMSLARAFFEAGAEAVVGSLWPLRDEDAEMLFDAFYRHLGEGMSVAAALRAAQRDRLRVGAPAEAWAGLVVLGHGEVVPVPGGRRGTPLGVWPWVLAGFLLAAALLALFRSRRRA
ncbi:MAG: CHAT domain-containing protein [bacterium]|nr:CHAT domain-containing protein [bacterium]